MIRGVENRVAWGRNVEISSLVPRRRTELNCITWSEKSRFPIIEYEASGSGTIWPEIYSPNVQVGSEMARLIILINMDRHSILIYGKMAEIQTKILDLYSI